MLGEMPYDREFIGMRCPHCASTNTVVEVYTKSREPRCMMCARNISEEEYVNHKIKKSYSKNFQARTC